MFTGFKQHKKATLQEAQFLQSVIQKKTNIKPEIYKVQDKKCNFFLVIEQPRKLLTEEDINQNIIGGTK